MKIIASLFCAGTLLSACMATQPSETANAAAGSGQCAADQYQGLLTQNEVALATMAFPGPVRVVHPGDPVTRDLRRDRITVQTDSTGQIVSVTCG
jgi:hypothetical protein